MAGSIRTSPFAGKQRERQVVLQVKLCNELLIGPKNVNLSESTMSPPLEKLIDLAAADYIPTAHRIFPSIDIMGSGVTYFSLSSLSLSL